MKIEANDWILGVWFAERTKGKNKGNVLITVIKKPEGIWYINVRTRFYLDDKVFHSQDRKKEHLLTFRDNPHIEHVEARVETMFDIAKHFFPDRAEHVDVKGDMDKMIFKLGMTDWAQFKKVTKDELERDFGISPNDL